MSTPVAAVRFREDLHLKVSSHTGHTNVKGPAEAGPLCSSMARNRARTRLS